MTHYPQKTTNINFIAHYFNVVYGNRTCNTLYLKFDTSIWCNTTTTQCNAGRVQQKCNESTMWSTNKLFSQCRKLYERYNNKYNIHKRVYTYSRLSLIFLMQCTVRLYIGMCVFTWQNFVQNSTNLYVN